MRLFIFTQLVPRDELDRDIGEPEIAALGALDLLRPDGNEHYYSPAFVYPVAGFVVASDRHDSPDGSGIVLASDVVFPALDAGTLRFLGIIARSPVRDALDLCSGTGIAALLLSKHAEHVVAADITPRSLRVRETDEHGADVRIHANGATGVASISIAVSDLEQSLARYAALLGLDASAHPVIQLPSGHKCQSPCSSCGRRRLRCCLLRRRSPFSRPASFRLRARGLRSFEGASGDPDDSPPGRSGRP